MFPHPDADRRGSTSERRMNAAKAVTAGVTAVVTGVGFVVASGTLHGTGLVIVEAIIAAVDIAASMYGVYLAPYTNQKPVAAFPDAVNAAKAQLQQAHAAVATAIDSLPNATAPPTSN